MAGLLEGAGYDVTRQVFTFPFFEELSPAVLEQLTPVSATYETGTFEFSGSGDVTGAVIPVDINLVGDRASTSGCEIGDFAGLDFTGTSDIALIQRGTCTFGQKAQNAQAAGAEAVVIFNQGNTDGRLGLIVGTLGDESAGVVTIPVVGASFDNGVALSQPGSTAHVATEVFLEIRTTENIIADSQFGNPDNVVMQGAHLDSVPAGPGIQDNGSGSAALITTALAMANVESVNKLRFAWWGAETEEQAAIWGGTVGDQFDPCYHEPCDTFDNVNVEALDVNVDAVAFAALTFAFSTESVNGVPGEHVPGSPQPLPTPAGPEGTFVTGGGASAPNHGDI